MFFAVKTKKRWLGSAVQPFLVIAFWTSAWIWASERQTGVYLSVHPLVGRVPVSTQEPPSDEL